MVEISDVLSLQQGLDLGWISCLMTFNSCFFFFFPKSLFWASFKVVTVYTRRYQITSWILIIPFLQCLTLWANSRQGILSISFRVPGGFILPGTWLEMEWIWVQIDYRLNVFLKKGTKVNESVLSSTKPKHDGNVTTPTKAAICCQLRKKAPIHKCRFV